eukprot:7005841-Pyramimonas_sp.AAC.1
MAERPGGNKDGGTTCQKKRAFMIEDAREACADLRTRGSTCDRISHAELMTTVGTEYLGAAIGGDYALIWVSAPGDWYGRTPGKRVAPHWSRIQNLLAKARNLRMIIIVFGPPGYVSEGDSNT